jgi:hypothetical protein
VKDRGKVKPGGNGNHLDRIQTLWMRFLLERLIGLQTGNQHISRNLRVHCHVLQILIFVKRGLRGIHTLVCFLEILPASVMKGNSDVSEKL